MKWNKYTIETTTAAEDYMSAMLADLGIEGVEIEDNIPLSKEDQADMFIDFLPELPPDDGVSHVSFYLEDDGEDRTELLKQVKEALEDLRKVLWMSEVAWSPPTRRRIWTGSTTGRNSSVPSISMTS